MRWLEDAPGGPGRSYCKGCFEERGTTTPCDGCPTRSEAALFPEHEQAGELYLLCREQWRYHEFSGRRLGLDMPGVQATAQMAGITIDREMLDALKTMERTALAVDREQHDQKN